MINRELIRLKVVQRIYEQNVNPHRLPDDNELDGFFDRTYRLYHRLLMFLVDLHRVAERQVEASLQRCQRLNITELPSRRFIDNPFILQLADNSQLKEQNANDKLSWMDQEQYLLKTYNMILQSDSYKQYMQLPAPTYDDHRQLWHDIYLQYVCNNEFIESLLEDEDLYWNDDKFIIDSFVLKTIGMFRENRSAEKPLLGIWRNDADRQFAFDLLRAAVKGADGYLEIITSHLQPGWDIERIARMDCVIMQVALAEIINFPDIPLSATFNEYIEIAKAYSTPQSGAYVNGMLEAMASTLYKQGVITKEITHK